MQNRVGQNGGRAGARAERDTRDRWRRRLALAGLILVMTVGLIGVAAFAHQDYARNIQALGDRLAVVADERLAAVEAWLARGSGDPALGPAERRGLMAALAGRATTWSSERTTLVLDRADQIRIVSPAEDGGMLPDPGPDTNSIGWVETEALAQPGGIHVGLDHTGRRVVAVSRAIPESPWVLVHAVDWSEAMAEATVRWRVLVAALVLCVLATGAGLVAAWRFGAAERMQAEAERDRHAAERHRAVSAFLDAVLNTQPYSVFVSDGAGRVSFANRSAEDLAGLARGRMVGTPAADVLGEDRGTAIQAIAAAVLESGAGRTDTLVFPAEDGAEHVWRTHAMPLEQPDGGPARVLITVEDMSSLMRERRRREETTERLIDTLVGLVDERDPDSANQSRYVALLAPIIAEHMGLEPVLVETAHQAARLVNIGKIRVPRALLTKTAPLTDIEMLRIREALDGGPDLVRDIAFDGPVLETLRQINEWVDGSGRPGGLTGEAILSTAQATALANSFVALVSPRAFRAGLPLEDAYRVVAADEGRRFDRRALDGLRAALDDPGTRALWASMGGQQPVPGEGAPTAVNPGDGPGDRPDLG